MTGQFLRGACAGSLLVALPLLAAAQAPTFDGQLTEAEWGTAIAVQRFDTQFGNDTSGDQFGFGSELDRMFAMNDADNLYVGITGNLENNGNCIVLFIDTDEGATGANPLFTRQNFFDDPVPGLPRYLGGDIGELDGLNEIDFDAGFAPNFAFGFSGGSPVGSQTRTFYLANLTEFADATAADPFAHTNTVLGLATAGDPTASGAAGTLSEFWPNSDNLGAKLVMDNSNVDGVPGGTQVVDPGEPESATTGMEAGIPLAALGVVPGDKVQLLALVSSPDGFVSNQLLPTDSTAADFGNLGNTPLNFATIDGDQFVSFTLTVPGCPNDPTGMACDTDVTGDCVVNNQDLGVLLAAYLTQLGDASYNPDVNFDNSGSSADRIDNVDLGELLADYLNNCN